MDETCAPLRVGIVGGGFVGKATSGFASRGVKVSMYDLQPHLRSPLDVCMEDIYDCHVVFVCVPTPMAKDGSCHTNIVYRVVKDLRNRGTKHIVVRSTVPVGTCDDLGTHFMPEFLTEKNWEVDFKGCSRWVVGVSDDGDDALEFQQLMTRIIEAAQRDGKVDHSTISFCSTKEAELVKYVRNCFLATKVAFCNEIYRFCEKKQLEYAVVADLACDDARIGRSHTEVPGHDGKFGFGGTCFPKDMGSLIHQFKSNHVPCPVLESAQVRNVNIDRPEQDWRNDQGRAVV